MDHRQKQIIPPAPVEEVFTNPNAVALTRREFTKLIMTALPAAGLFSFAKGLNAAETSVPSGGKPNSKVAGVQIGLNVPYSFASLLMSGEDILKNCVHLGL